jgi:hypothetical protein
MKRTKELVGKAKIAEEKRQERAIKREVAQKNQQQQAVPVSVGGITVNVTIQQGGAVQTTTEPKEKPKAKSEYKRRASPRVFAHIYGMSILGKKKGRDSVTLVG